MTPELLHVTSLTHHPPPAALGVRRFPFRSRFTANADPVLRASNKLSITPSWSSSDGGENIQLLEEMLEMKYEILNRLFNRVDSGSEFPGLKTTVFAHFWAVLGAYKRHTPPTYWSTFSPDLY